MPRITEQHGLNGRRDEPGHQVTRVFDVDHTSEIAALSYLASERGVFYWAGYFNPKGELLDTSLRCVSLDYRAKRYAPPGGEGTYEITATWAIPTALDLEPSVSADPVYDFGPSELRRQPVDVDVHGWPIVNSAGDAFDPPLTAEVQVTQVRVRWFVSSMDPTTLISYRNSVNSAPWSFLDSSGVVIGAYQAKIRSLSPAPAVDNLVKMEMLAEIRALRDIPSGVEFWVRNPDGSWGDGAGNFQAIASPFTLAKRPFSDWVVDRGYREIDAGASGTGGHAVKQIVLGDREVTQPVELNGAGLVRQSSANRVVLVVEHYGAVPFAGLGV